MNVTNEPFPVKYDWKSVRFSKLRNWEKRCWIQTTFIFLETPNL
jgi:hypothetical protein